MPCEYQVHTTSEEIPSYIHTNYSCFHFSLLFSQMSSLPSVAIAGATGNVGAKVAAEFLKPEFRARYKQVIILSRSSASETARRLGDLGATIRVYEEEALAAVLSDVDILVNACVFSHKDIISCSFKKLIRYSQSWSHRPRAQGKASSMSTPDTREIILSL